MMMATTSCPARFSTPRTKSRPTLGPRVAKLAHAYLGYELMPWQRHVLNVALEVDPVTHRLIYREVGLTIPRQSGKTTLVFCLFMARMIDKRAWGLHQRVAYAAQTGKDAKQKWEQDFLEVLEESAKLQEGRDYTVSKATGSEGLFFPASKGRFGLKAPTKKSGHGGTLDLAFIDEAFAQIDARLEQAFKPAMVTRPQPQLWVVSTAGDETSTYLRGKVDNGRKLALAGHNEGVAYFEWSAPQDADPEDESVWWGCMPALGRTATIEAVRADFTSMELSEFRRAYLNQWVPANTEPPALDPVAWAQLGDEVRGADLHGELFYAIDVADDRTAACISVAGKRAKDGISQVEVIDNMAGVDWIIPRLLGVFERHGKGSVAVSTTGPAAPLIPLLEKRGVQVVKVGHAELGAACGGFYDAFLLGSLRHLNDARLNRAVSASRKRISGDIWVWDRRIPGADLSPLTASTLAFWLLQSRNPSRITSLVW